MSRKRNKKGKKTKIILILSLLFVSIIVVTAIILKTNYEKNEELRQEEIKEDILSHYNEYVMTNKEADIYTLSNGKFTKSGKISKGEELTLDTKDITYEDEYLKIKTFEEEYYIYYKDLDIIEELTSNENNRYQKYIVFNKNIVTKDTVNFYDEENNLVYTFNKSFNLPIIINKEEIYGVEYNKQLLYVK